MLKEKLRNYLSFGKRDRLGILVLLFLIIVTCLLPSVLKKPAGPFPFEPDAVLRSAMDTISRREAAVPGGGTYRARPKVVPAPQPFTFDPNTLPAEGWKRLGLNERTVRTIENYRSKGGRFRTTEDLKKIWGLPPAFYERVKDYVAIEVTAKESKNDFFKPSPAPKEKKATVIQINDADTSAFIALPGIGSKLAARIVSFRNRLGGFYSVEQIGETFGLQDSVFQKIRQYLVVEGTVRTININTATKEELAMHPYISWKLADAIVAYRNQHGTFGELGELKNILLVDEAVFQKLRHYLVL